MSTIFAISLTMLCAYITSLVDNLLFSRLITSIFLIAIGLLTKSSILSVLITVFLLFSKTLYFPIKSDVIKDIENYLFNKILLKSQTYLMLVFTGGIFIGLALPAVKNYPISISVFVFLTNFFIYLVEYSNKIKFKEKIKKVNQTSDPLEALKEAFELMLPFKQFNAEELIKNRLEIWKNNKEKRINKN